MLFPSVAVERRDILRLLERRTPIQRRVSPMNIAEIPERRQLLFQVNRIPEQQQI